MSIKALILRTAGTNCDAETIHALQLSGAQTELLHIREIFYTPKRLLQYSIMVIPGGFAYGDDIAAGKILSNELKFKLRKPVQQFISEQRLMIGICNGFQVLVKSGILPGNSSFDFEQTATLTQNNSGKFQCEWVSLKKEASRAEWLNGLSPNFELPIAHGEGKFVMKDSKALVQLEKNKQVVFRYIPKNPNGSMHDIAGICNTTGNVIGLMPHPERFVSQFQHPAWSRGDIKSPSAGLVFWQSAVKYARQIK